MNILLLGGIGAGKSEALKILKDKFFANIIEADSIAHFLYEKDKPGYKSLVSLFGEAVLDNEKNIDRKKLGDILYYDKEKLEEVNSIIHPLVKEEIQNRLLKNRLNIVEQALLPDKTVKYDAVWYLYADTDIRVRRLMLNRGLDKAKIKQIMSRQPKDSEYMYIADRIIKNNGDVEELEKEIREALKVTA